MDAIFPLRLHGSYIYVTLPGTQVSGLLVVVIELGSAVTGLLELVVVDDGVVESVTSKHADKVDSRGYFPPSQDCPLWSSILRAQIIPPPNPPDLM